MWYNNFFRNKKLTKYFYRGKQISYIETKNSKNLLRPIFYNQSTNMNIFIRLKISYFKVNGFYY